mgnify:CR=1 FL=1
MKKDKRGGVSFETFNRHIIIQSHTFFPCLSLFPCVKTPLLKLSNQITTYYCLFCSAVFYLDRDTDINIYVEKPSFWAKGWWCDLSGFQIEFNLAQTSVGVLSTHFLLDAVDHLVQHNF